MKLLTLIALGLLFFCLFLWAKREERNTDGEP